MQADKQHFISIISFIYEFNTWAAAINILSIIYEFFCIL